MTMFGVASQDDRNTRLAFFESSGTATVHQEEADHKCGSLDLEQSPEAMSIWI